jgi:hypothetical protein
LMRLYLTMPTRSQLPQIDSVSGRFYRRGNQAVTTKIRRTSSKRAAAVLAGGS